MPLAAQSLIQDAEVVGNKVVMVGERGHIFVGRPGEWQQKISPSNTMLNAVYFLDEQKGWAVGEAAVILATEDGGQTWRLQNYAPQENPLFAIYFLDNNRGIAAGAYGTFYLTQDGGRSWRPHTNSKDDRHIYAIIADGQGGLLLAGEAGGVWQLTSFSQTPALLSSPSAASIFGLLRLTDGKIVAYGLRGGLFVSQDNAQSWQAIQSGTVSSLMGATGSPSGQVLIAGLQGAVVTGDINKPSVTIRDNRAAFSGAFYFNNHFWLIGENGVTAWP